MTASLGGLGPTYIASPLAQPPPACRRCAVGRPARNATELARTSGVSARSGEMSSTIQIPRPCVPITRSWDLDRGRHRSEEHTSELQSRPHLVCRLLLAKKKTVSMHTTTNPSIPYERQHLHTLTY